MENKISFAEYIKNEILDFDWDEKQLSILFYSFLKTNGVFRADNFIVGTSLFSKKEFIQSLFKKIFNTEPKVEVLKTKINFIINDKDFIDQFYKFESNLKLKKDLDWMAYIAGAFIGKGWISRPSSRSYHMEFRIGSIDHSLNLQEAIDSLGIKTTTVSKGRWYVTYIKRSMSLADLLRAMQAHQAMMIFEEERINRDFSASYSKMESIEEYNLGKTREVSKKQIAAIEKLQQSQVWTTVKKDKKLIAELRVEKKSYSLSDLQYTFNSRHGKNVSKSTINNWLKSLVDLAEIS